MVCYARIVANYTDKQNLPSKNKTRETERKKTNKINPGLAFSSSSYPSVWSACCRYCRRGLLSVPGITSLSFFPPSLSSKPINSSTNPSRSPLPPKCPSYFE